MLSLYLNQLAEYKPRTGTDDRGQPEYGDCVKMECRYQRKTQNVVTATGQVVQAQHVYYVTDKVDVGDMLNGLVIMAVSDWVDLSGNIIGHKAVM